MYCPYCGKENVSSNLFCSECGKPLQNVNQNPIPIGTPASPKKNKEILLGVITVVSIFIAIAIVIVRVVSKSYDVEYSNNSGEMLPIVVNQISYQESYWTGFIDITFEIENVTQHDYKNASLAVLAWDSRGYPVRMYKMYEFDSDYMSYIDLENIGPTKSNMETYTFESVDIAYMSVFLAYYEDFDGNEWKNPIIKEVEKKQGQKIDETNLYYFTFQ